ncbi:MAG: DUF5309 family protein, partial [Gammaproteobacteria bacterium]|nr:DUF5309 family protein [Gammaproteobacteria bacterium]
MCAFTGKATYDPGAPPGEEIAEDVSPNIMMISRAETPLLDILSPPDQPAWSTHHEWLDDALLPDRTLTTASAASAGSAISVTTGEGKFFRAGDLIMAAKISATAASSYARDEVIYVVSVSTDDLIVTRGYGSTTKTAIALGDEIQRVGRSELEGADSPALANNNMNRRSNYCQIYTEPVNISGSLQAARILGGVGVNGTNNRELSKRLAEILADLERATIRSVAPAATVQGSSTVRRTMDGA